MRSIVGVRERVSGAIEVLGAPAGVASRRGDVPQDPSVYGDLTAHENLTFFAHLLGAPAYSPIAMRWPDRWSWSRTCSR